LTGQLQELLAIKQQIRLKIYMKNAQFSQDLLPDSTFSSCKYSGLDCQDESSMEGSHYQLNVSTDMSVHLWFSGAECLSHFDLPTVPDGSRTLID